MEDHGIRVCNLRLGLTADQVLRISGQPEIKTEAMWRYLSSRRNLGSPEEVAFDHGLVVRIRGKIVSLFGRTILDDRSSRAEIENCLGAPDGFHPKNFEAVYRKFDLQVARTDSRNHYTLNQYLGPLITEQEIGTNRRQRRPRMLAKVVSEWISSNEKKISEDAYLKLEKAVRHVENLCEVDSTAVDLKAAIANLEEVFIDCTGRPLWMLKPKH